MNASARVSWEGWGIMGKTMKNPALFGGRSFLNETDSANSFQKGVAIIGNMGDMAKYDQQVVGYAPRSSPPWPNGSWWNLEDFLVLEVPMSPSADSLHGPRNNDFSTAGHAYTPVSNW